MLLDQGNFRFGRPGYVAPHHGASCPATKRAPFSAENQSVRSVSIYGEYHVYLLFTLVVVIVGKNASGKGTDTGQDAPSDLMYKTRVMM